MDEIASRKEKVPKFEEFMNRRLKLDLVKAVAQLDKVFQQQKVLYQEEHIEPSVERRDIPLYHG